MTFIGIAAVAAAVGLIPAKIASDKGRDFLTWWIYGTCLPLISIIHAATLQPTRQAMRADGYLPCPWCKEMIRSDASVCRYCGRDFADVTDYTGQ